MPITADSGMPSRTAPSRRADAESGLWRPLPSAPVRAHPVFASSPPDRLVTGEIGQGAEGETERDGVGASQVVGVLGELEGDGA